MVKSECRRAARPPAGPADGEEARGRLTLLLYEQIFGGQGLGDLEQT